MTWLKKEPDENLIGRYVYEAYKPKKPGIILSISEEMVSNLVGFPPRKERVALVRFLNKTEEKIELGRLQDFQALIADHQSKLNVHIAKKTQLDEMKRD